MRAECGVTAYVLLGGACERGYSSYLLLGGAYECGVTSCLLLGGAYECLGGAYECGYKVRVEDSPSAEGGGRAAE